MPPRRKSKKKRGSVLAEIAAGEVLKKPFDRFPLQKAAGEKEKGRFSGEKRPF